MKNVAIEIKNMNDIYTLESMFHCKKSNLQTYLNIKKRMKYGVSGEMSVVIRRTKFRVIYFKTGFNFRQSDPVIYGVKPDHHLTFEEVKLLKSLEEKCTLK